jgi:hypothetical protein
MNDQSSKGMSLHDAEILTQMGIRFYQAGVFGQSEWYFRQALNGYRLHKPGEKEMGYVVLYLAESLFFQGKSGCLELYAEALPILQNFGCTPEVECIEQRLSHVLDVETRGQMPQ